jgi:hypothetical protein
MRIHGIGLTRAADPALAGALLTPQGVGKPAMWLALRSPF